MKMDNCQKDIIKSEIKSEKVFKKIGQQTINNKKDKMKTKMKSYKVKIKTYFPDKDMPWKGFQ